jgi:hypothetical protein
MNIAKTKLYIGISTVSIFLTPLFVFAFATPAGLVDSGIWLSGEPKANETISVYSAVFNGYDKTLLGTVQFYDYNTLLGEKNFSVLPKSIATLSVSWKVDIGDHKLQARVVNPTLKASNSDDAIFLDWHKTSELKISVIPETSTRVTKEDSQDKKDGDESLIASIGDTFSSTVDGIGNFVSDKTPEGIKDTTSSVFDTLETFRIKEADSFALKKEEAKKEYDSLKKDEPASGGSNDKKDDSEDSGGKLQKPLKLLTLAGVSAAKIAFNSPYVFYSLLVIIIFLILRAIWKWFRREDFGSSDDE